MKEGLQRHAPPTAPCCGHKNPRKEGEGLPSPSTLVAEEWSWTNTCPDKQASCFCKTKAASSTRARMRESGAKREKDAYLHSANKLGRCWAQNRLPVHLHSLRGTVYYHNTWVIGNMNKLKRKSHFTAGI